MSDSEKSDIQKTAPQIYADLAKQMYADIAQPSSKVFGEGLAGIFKAITLYPRYWGQRSDISLPKMMDAFIDNLNSRVDPIPEGDRILPHPNIIGPSIQALEYGIFDDHLSDMFAKLIATSMDARVSSSAHPAFVDLIRQINSDEAKIIKLLGDSEHYEFPICNVNVSVDGDGVYDILIRRYHAILKDSGSDDLKMFGETIDNLERLKIIEVSLYSGGPLVSDRSRYKSLIDDMSYHFGSKIIEHPSNEGSRGVNAGDYFFTLGLFYLTAFGKQFYKACVK